MHLRCQHVLLLLLHPHQIILLLPLSKHTLVLLLLPQRTQSQVAEVLLADGTIVLENVLNDPLVGDVPASQLLGLRGRAREGFGTGSLSCQHHHCHSICLKHVLSVTNGSLVDGWEGCDASWIC